MDQQNETLYPPVSAIFTGLRCKCPRCGQGRLFRGLFVPFKQCLVCGLDYSFIDSGDGPAVFVILLLGFVVISLALILRTLFSPPLWVHALLWFPLIIIGGLWALRVMKAIMITLQYKTNAGEGKRFQ